MLAENGLLGLCSRNGVVQRTYTLHGTIVTSTGLIGNQEVGQFENERQGCKKSLSLGSERNGGLPAVESQTDILEL